MYKASAVSAYRYNHRRGQICRSHIRLIIFLSLCSILAFAEEETTDAKPAETKAATEEKASDISLPDVLVTANRTEVEKKKAASSYTVISGEELEKKKIRSLYEALRKSPGLTVSNAGGRGGNTSVFLRGTNSGHVLVLIDGVRANVNTQGAFDLGNFSVLNIERIEIIRGPQSTIYGSEAIGGVINIITKKSQQKRLAGSATIAFGERNYRSQSFNVSGKLGRIDFATAVTSMKDDGFSAHIDGLEDDLYESFAFSQHLGFQLLDITRLDLYYRYLDSSKNIDGFAGDSLTAFIDVESHYGGAKVTHDFSEIFTQELSYGYLDQDLMGETYTILNDTIEAGTKSIFKYMKHMELVAGYDYLYQRGRAAGYDKDTTTHSFYAEHLASLDPFFVTLGIRNDDHSEFGDETTYRASLSYELNQYTLLHTSYGTGFKAPTLNDLFWPFQDFGIFGSYQGNPNLKPETSKGWDFGIRNNFMDGAIKTDVTYFYNEIDDLIIYATGFPGPFDGSLINVDEAKTQGVEVSADFMIYDKLAVGLAYTYTDTEDLSDSSRLPRRPLHTIAGNVHYYANDKLDFGFDLSSQNGRTNTSDELMEEFTRIDFVLNYAPEDDLLFFIKVHNMFDEAYEEVDNFGSSGSHSSAGVKFIF